MVRCVFGPVILTWPFGVPVTETRSRLLVTRFGCFLATRLCCFLVAWFAAGAASGAMAVAAALGAAVAVDARRAVPTRRGMVARILRASGLGQFLLCAITLSGQAIE